jgi:hypothetical protein
MNNNSIVGIRNWRVKIDWLMRHTEKQHLGTSQQDIDPWKHFGSCNCNREQKRRQQHADHRRFFHARLSNITYPPEEEKLLQPTAKGETCFFFSSGTFQLIKKLFGVCVLLAKDFSKDSFDFCSTKGKVKVEESFISIQTLS